MSQKFIAPLNRWAKDEGGKETWKRCAEGHAAVIYSFNLHRIIFFPHFVSQVLSFQPFKLSYYSQGWKKWRISDSNKVHLQTGPSEERAKNRARDFSDQEKEKRVWLEWSVISSAFHSTHRKADHAYILPSHFH